MKHFTRMFALALLASLGTAAWAAGADLGQAEKQATNWTAIIMFGVFIAGTMFITNTTSPSSSWAHS
jgi:cation/acetate symporter